MSERQEKKARHTRKLEFICAYKEGSEKWIRRIYGGRRSW